MELPDFSEYRWVSCSKEADWASAEKRHLIVPGRLTTVCGATASHADVWRVNSTKPNCSRCMKKGKAIVEWQTQQLVQLMTPPEAPAVHVELPRKVVFSVNASVHLVEEKPVEVSVIPVGQMSRVTVRAIAYAALAEAGVEFAELDSNGFSPAGAFFGVRLPEPEAETEPIKLTDCNCTYNTHRPPGGYTRTDVHRNPKCPVHGK